MNQYIRQVVTLLQAGEIVAIPTETVYGLAADATQDRAVAKIYALKDRPKFNPLIIHVASIEEVWIWGQVTPHAKKLAEAFWPGALTLVLKRQPETPLSLLVSAGLDTIAIRVPSHLLTLELLREVGVPLAAPSANRSTEISPTSAEDVRASFGEDAPFILDGGPCTVGLESTIVDLSTETPTLLRPGGISKESIEALIGPLTVPDASPIKAPGMMRRHYAPSIPLRLDVGKPDDGEAYIGFGKMDCTINLSESENLEEAAANLFHHLRFVDKPSYRGIAVAPIPNHGLGLAINDRLKRAAASKEDAI